MAINKKLVHFKTFANFQNELNNNNILDTSIVFIKDKLWLYTHGLYYHCDNLSVLSDDYAASLLENEELQPVAGDTVEEAISKLHKAMLDNKQVVTQTVLKLQDVIGFNEYIEYTPTSTNLVNKNITEAIDYLDSNKVSVSTTINGLTLDSNITIDKNSLGLGNIDNTSDLDKPISTATLTELDLKVDITTIFGELTTPAEGSPIVLYDSVNDCKIKVLPDDYNLDTYPKDRYTPIGIVIIPKSHIKVITGKAVDIMVSLKHMNCSAPDTGGSAQGIYWGGNGTDISELFNYTKAPVITNNVTQGASYSRSISFSGIYEEPTLIGSEELSGDEQVDNGIMMAALGDEGTGEDPTQPSYYSCIPSDKLSGTESQACPGTYYDYSSKLCPSPFLVKNGVYEPNPAYYEEWNSTTPSVTSDFKGKENTQIICSKITVADWQTATSITNSSDAGNYPAAACCWRYSTPGTSQGDWYLPAAGELGYLMPFFTQHNKAVTAINNVYGAGTAILLGSSDYYWSSSEYSSNFAFMLSSYSGTLSFYNKDYSSYVVAFCGVDIKEEEPLIYQLAKKEDLKLSKSYTPSKLTNQELQPVANDSYETAISKLHKSILDDELTVADTFVTLKNSIGLTDNGLYESTNVNLLDKTITEAIDYLASNTELSINLMSILIEPSTGANYSIKFYNGKSILTMNLLRSLGYTYNIKGWGNYTSSGLFLVTILNSDSDPNYVTINNWSFPETDSDTILLSELLGSSMPIDYSEIQIKLNLNLSTVATLSITIPLNDYWINVRPSTDTYIVSHLYVHNKNNTLITEQIRTSSLKLVIDAFNLYDETSSTGVTSTNSTLYVYNMSELPSDYFVDNSLKIGSLPCYSSLKNYYIIRILLRNSLGHGLSETFIHNSNPYTPTKYQLKSIYTEISSNITLGSYTTEEGMYKHLVYYNSSSSDVTIAVPNTYISFSGTTLTVPALGYLEINILRSNNNYLLRAL